MGYSHYWYRPTELDKEKFKQAAADCKKVTEWLKAPIQCEYDVDAPPVLSDSLIRFNGIGEEGHETFYINRHFKPYYPDVEKKEEGWFAFCKTARKEYDTAVTACLIVLKHYFGDDLVVRSDGYPEEWQEGLRACQECLGYGEVPFKKEKKRAYFNPT